MGYLILRMRFLGDLKPLPWHATALLAANMVFFSVIGLVVLNTGCRGLLPLRDKRLRYVGRISYGLYLYHLPMLGVVEVTYLKLHLSQRLGILSEPFHILFPAGLCLLVAALSWKYIEEPILCLKNRFDYHRQPACSAESVLPSRVKDLS